jgi:hypothetical protein
MVHGRQLQLYGMPMVGSGMVATYLTLATTGVNFLKTVITFFSMKHVLFIV